MSKELCPYSWDKISLENAIFARAMQENKPVWASAGHLQVQGASDFLQALVRVYVKFFEPENILFMRGDNLYMYSIYAHLHKEFKRQQHKYPLAETFYLSPGGFKG